MSWETLLFFLRISRLPFVTFGVTIHFNNPFCNFVQSLMSGSLIYAQSTHTFISFKMCFVITPRFSLPLHLLFSTPSLPPSPNSPHRSALLAHCLAPPPCEGAHLSQSTPRPLRPTIDTHSLLSLFVLPSPAWGSSSLTQELGSVATESPCFVFVVCYHHLSQAEGLPLPACSSCSWM